MLAMSLPPLHVVIEFQLDESSITIGRRRFAPMRRSS
jgi:hypothetical protein